MSNKRDRSTESYKTAASTNSARPNSTASSNSFTPFQSNVGPDTKATDVPNTMTSTHNVEGLRKQILSNAALLFPGIVEHHVKSMGAHGGYQRPRDDHNIVNPDSWLDIVIRMPNDTLYEAFLIHGNYPLPETLVQGKESSSIDGALLELLKTMCVAMTSDGPEILDNLRNKRGNIGLYTGGIIDASALKESRAMVVKLRNKHPALQSDTESLQSSNGSPQVLPEAPTPPTEFSQDVSPFDFSREGSKD